MFVCVFLFLSLPFYVFAMVLVPEINLMMIVRKSDSPTVRSSFSQDKTVMLGLGLAVGLSAFGLSNLRTIDTQSLPARRYASAGLFESNVSVRLPVRLSQAGICIKTKKASVMISSLSGSPTILVFCCQISSQNSKKVTPSGGVKERRGG